MKFIFLFFLGFLVLFPSSALAQSVLPNQHPNLDSGYYNIAYCVYDYEILHEKDIYTCRRVLPHFNLSSYTAQASYNSSHSICWTGYSYGFNEGFISGIVLDRKISISNTLPSNYNTPCKLKKASENPIVCSQPIDVRALVQGAFWNKFPMDLLANFSSNPPPTACPSFTIRGQTFELCYLNKLTASLKYVLLVIFIISSVIAL